MLVQMRGNPADRLFNDRELPETYLKLRHQVKVDYVYRHITEINKQKLSS